MDKPVFPPELWRIDRNGLIEQWTFVGNPPASMCFGEPEKIGVYMTPISACVIRESDLKGVGAFASKWHTDPVKMSRQYLGEQEQSHKSLANMHEESLHDFLNIPRASTNWLILAENWTVLGRLTSNPNDWAYMCDKGAWTCKVDPLSKTFTFTGQDAPHRNKMGLGDHWWLDTLNDEDLPPELKKRWDAAK